jgi:hypothetical protein
MTALVRCQACQAGDCANCEGGRPAPPGMLGGTECPCKGDCAAKLDDGYAGGFPSDPIVRALLEADDG